MITKKTSRIAATWLHPGELSLVYRLSLWITLISSLTSNITKQWTMPNQWKDLSMGRLRFPGMIRKCSGLKRSQTLRTLCSIRTSKLSTSKSWNYRGLSKFRMSSMWRGSSQSGTVPKVTCRHIGQTVCAGENQHLIIKVVTIMVTDRERTHVGSDFFSRPFNMTKAYLFLK